MDNERLIRVESDYFCIGLFLTPQNTIRFPDMEPRATLTFKAFLDGVSWEVFEKTAERMKWKVRVSK